MFSKVLEPQPGDACPGGLKSAYSFYGRNELYCIVDGEPLDKL